MAEETHGTPNAGVAAEERKPHISAGFVAPAALLSGAVGFVASQVGMVVATEGDLSFWGFAIIASGLFAVAAGVAIAVSGLIALAVARRTLAAEGSPRRRAVAAIVAGIPLAVFTVFLGAPLIAQGGTFAVIVWAVVAAPIVAGGAVAGGLVRMQPPAIT